MDLYLTAERIVKIFQWTRFFGFGFESSETAGGRTALKRVAGEKGTLGAKVSDPFGQFCERGDSGRIVVGSQVDVLVAVVTQEAHGSPCGVIYEGIFEFSAQPIVTSMMAHPHSVSCFAPQTLPIGCSPDAGADLLLPVEGVDVVLVASAELGAGREHARRYES